MLKSRFPAPSDCQGRNFLYKHPSPFRKKNEDVATKKCVLPVERDNVLLEELGENGGIAVVVSARSCEIFVEDMNPLTQ